MEVIDIEDSLDEIVERFNRSAHSRFTVPRADSRRLTTLLAPRLPDAPA
jgi:Mg2+/Co2+ transporter CorC